MEQPVMGKPDKDLHSLLLDRIYHEDQLFTQRTDNFVTINAFFAAVFALSVADDQITYFAYIIAGFGLLLGLFQVALGVRLEATSNFWRQYLWLVEKQIGINFDRAQFEFYDKGEVRTPAGVIVSADTRKKPMYQTFPWSIPFLPSVNILIGVIIPWSVASFWLLLLLVLLYRENLIWVAVVLLLAFIFLFLVSRRWGLPAQPKGQES